tara:strand:- start:301 stop:471 length:171 start_codon:yes stop_codon:yes gene_type:complete
VSGVFKTDGSTRALTLRPHLVTVKKESFCSYLNTPLVCKECKKTTLKKSREDKPGN